MKVLFAASECAPISSTGGLGEVIASLPRYIKKRNVEANVITPLYPDIPDYLAERIETVKSLSVKVGWRKQYFDLKKVDHHGITLYFIDQPYYFNRDSIYNQFDDGERFAFFSMAITEALPHLSFKPDIVHCHDWHTGLVSYYIKKRAQKEPFYQSIRTLFTIHNLAYQGIFSKQLLGDVLSLSMKDFTLEGIEFHDNISYLKAGIVSADKISTVSATYKEEILSSFAGSGLEGLLSERQHDLTGILNGIDDEIYNPETDKYVKHPYSIENLNKKEQDKKALQNRVFLPKRNNVPLFAIIGPLNEQKGIPLLIDTLDRLLQFDIQLVIHGQGETKWESDLSSIAGRYPKKFKVILEYDQELAHKIYAGADFLLIPSQFEPCGLEALIGLRYGTIPIARETGGLKEIVESYNGITHHGNGFTFHEYSVNSLLSTISFALKVYTDEDKWRKLLKQSMSSYRSWDIAAQDYLQLYLDMAHIQPRSVPVDV